MTWTTLSQSRASKSPFGLAVTVPELGSGSCLSFYLHLMHLFLASPFLSPAPNLTSFLVLQCFHGSLGSKRNVGDGFAGVRTIIMKVQRSWDLSYFDLWEKKSILKNQGFKTVLCNTNILQLWRDTLQDLFCLIQDTLQIESFPAGKINKKITQHMDHCVL